MVNLKPIRQKILIVMVGNIGSGKTTYVKQLQKDGYIVISKDALRYAIGGGKYVFNPRYEPIIFSTEAYMLKKFLDLGLNIVVDGVAISTYLRAVYIKEAQQRGYKLICKLMPTLSKEDSVNRRMQEPHGHYSREVWEKVWENFDDLYEEPTLKEGFNAVEYIGKEK